MSEQQENPQSPVPGAVAPTQEAQPQSPQLNASDSVIIDGKQVTLGELAQTYTKASQQPQLDQESLQQFETFQKAMQGDAEATQQLWQQYAPKQQEDVTPGHDQSDTIKALKEELETVKQTINQAKGVTDWVEHAHGQRQLTEMVKASEQNFPNVAAHPQAASLVERKLNELNSLAAQQGIDLASADVNTRTKALSIAFDSVEKDIIQTVQAYGGKPRTVGQAQPIQAVDDQNAPSIDSRIQRARYGVNPQTGELFDRTTGKSINQGQSDKYVPDAPVSGVPSGTVPAEVQDLQNKAFSAQQMMQAIRERSEIL